MNRDPFGLEHGRDPACATGPHGGQNVRVEQNRRQFAEQVGLGAASGVGIGPRIDQGAAAIARGDPAVVETFADPPFLEPMAVQGHLGEILLLLAIRQPCQQPGLAKGDAARLQRHQSGGRDAGQGRQSLDLDLVVTECPRHGRDRQLRLQHPADGRDDIGHMDRNGGVGQQHRRRLASRIGLDIGADRIVLVDVAGLEQDRQGQAAPAAVEGHEGLLLLAAARANGDGLKLSGRLQGGGQGRNVLVRRFAIAQVLSRDAEIAETDDAFHGREDDGRGRGFWSRGCGGDGGNEGGHEVSPAGRRSPSPPLRRPSAPSLLPLRCRRDRDLVPVAERRLGP